MSTINASVKVQIGNVTGLLARVQTGVRNGVTDGAQIIETEAKRLCPVDTGALRESIDTKIYEGVNAAKRGGELSSSLYAVTAEVGPHMPYGPYVEYGTGQRGASSGSGPGPYSDRPGMVAQPFMRPAADEHQAEVVDAIRSSVASELR